MNQTSNPCEFPAWNSSRNDQDLPTVTVAPERWGAWIHGNPWIFSGSVRSISPSCKEPAWVKVVFEGREANPLPIAAYYPGASLALRGLGVSAWQDIPFSLSKALLSRPDNYVGRLINSDHDGWPGLVVDQFQDTLVCQAHSWPAEQLMDLCRQIATQAGRILVMRNDQKFRRREKLPLYKWCSHPDPEQLQQRLITVGQAPFRAQTPALWWDGQKTGLFLDHQFLDQCIASSVGDWPSIQNQKKFLNLFSYLGVSSWVAAKAVSNVHAGSRLHVTNVDTSSLIAPYIQAAAQANEIAPENHQLISSDVQDCWGKLNGPYSAILMDPPNLTNRIQDRKAAQKFYRGLFSQALKVSAAGTHWFVGSCSSHLSHQDILQAMPHQVQVLGYGMGSPQYPTKPNLQETQYFKWFWLKVVN